MARARIQINGVTQTAATVTIGSAVLLSNDDEGGELTYAWSFLDQPDGTPDALSNTIVENPVFNPTKEGSYAIRLVVNALLPTQVIQTAVVSVLDARSQERFPAATETVEVSTVKGWAQAANRILVKAMRSYADGGALVIAQTPGGIPNGSIVNFRGVATINSGTQAQDVVPAITLALATDADSVSDRLGVLIDGVVPGQITAGKLVIVRTSGPAPLASSGVPSGIGDPVYVGNTGTPVLAPGTSSRRIGRVVSFGAGTYLWSFDNISQGSNAVADDDYEDIVVSNSGATWTIANGVVSNLKFLPAPALTLKGNPTGVTANVQDITIAELLSLLNLSGYDIGDGSDGSATMDGTTAVVGYALSNPGASGIYTALRRVNFVDLTVNNGITCIQTSHPGPFVRGVLTLNGNINADGVNASGQTGGVNPAATGPLPTGTSGGNGGGVNGGGVNGLASGRCPRGFSTATAAGGVGGIPPTAGVAGLDGHGGGGGASLASGGFGGGITLNPTANGDIGALYAASTANVEVPTGGTPTKYTCGSGGGGGAGGGTGAIGGGGGAGGNWLVIGAGIFVVGSGTISCKGGNGGNGTAATVAGQAGSGGGAGGGGGFVCLIDPSRTAPTPIVTGGLVGTPGAPASPGGAASTAGAGGIGVVRKYQ